MAVAPLSTTKHPQMSEWSTEPPENPIKLISQNNQQQSSSVCLPLLVGLTFSLLLGGIALATTTADTTITAIWDFNNNTNDQNNVYNGVAVNTPTYATGYTNLAGTAMTFIGASSQYVKVASPFLNLTYKTFTVEIWFCPTTLTLSDYGLFSQCQTTSPNLCLMFMIRNYRLYLTFHSDDLSASTTLFVNTWYHATFIYDFSTSIQSIYLNGILENSRISGAYKGMTASIFIGATDNGTKSYFTGYIDKVSLITRAKTTAELLYTATLVSYYSFDYRSYADSGPLGIIGTDVNIATASGNGRINDAISFTSAPAYFVFGGLNKLGIAGTPYSISIWIKPTSVNGGTIIHVSKCNYNCPFAWCLAFMGFTSTGQIAVQSWNVGNILVSLTGPTISANTWTHVANTYSPANGLRLYVNGALSNQSYNYTYSASGLPNYIYLGYFPLTLCAGGYPISGGQYYGLLDEFRLFSREITTTEVYTLANP